MKTSALLFVIAGGLLVMPPRAPAWEATTTSAGITEQAALSSTLHQHMTEQLGQAGGMFAPMRIPRADAATLYEVLDKLNPSDGQVPDANGRQLALSWLAAGAAIADTPAEHAINHFYDPSTRKGATLPGGLGSLRKKITSVAVRERLLTGGVPATEWLDSVDNPMGTVGFAQQYRKAVNSRTPAERERHAAATLLAAGAIVHIVADMASPAHVRGDLESFFDRVSGDETDVGSRFERIATLAYGRLGVGRPTETIKRKKLVDFITSDDGTGLADVVSSRYFSKNTVPRAIKVKRGESSATIAERMRAALVRATPAPVGPFDLVTARTPSGARLNSATGTCLAHYHLDGTRLSFSVPDDCAIEQLAELLPLAAGYASGVLEFLFRGTLTVESSGTMIAIKTGALGVGAGKVTAFWDDELGVRTQYAQLEAVSGAKAGGSLGQVAAPPAAAKAIAVLYEGIDENGEAVNAARYSTWPLAKKKK